jgi:hypothetical protein
MSLYGVVVVDKSVIRDINISNILNENNDILNSGNYKGEFEFIIGKDRIFTAHSLKYLSQGRVYKTLKGAKNFYNEVMIFIKSNNFYNSHLLSRYNPSEKSILICEISKHWNDMLDILIDCENDRHKIEIEKLRNKYI